MGKGQKRKLQEGPSSSRAIYQNVTVVPRVSTGRPGTPHSFFESSHEVSIGSAATKRAKPDETTPTAAIAVHSNLTVHRHANGLCIVTLGEKPPPSMVSVRYLLQPGSECSSAERRKRLFSLQKGKGNVDGAVTPTTPMLELVDSRGTVLTVPAGIWGLLLEVNPNMSVQLLERDSLLDGYVAVILPTGIFPPPTDDVSCCDPARNEALDAIVKENAGITG
jgi:hypothetical protein